jgi:hypothetical protein
MLQGFLSSVTMDMPFLGYYAVHSGNFLLIFKESLLAPSSRVKKIQDFSWFSLLGSLLP